MIPFNAYTALNAFHWAGQRLKMLLLIGRSGPQLIHSSLGPRESALKRHLDQFSRFRTAHTCDQYTGR